MGIRVTLGHDANNIVGADMVVYSAAIPKDNVELAAAESYGIPTVERSVLLGYVSRLYKSSICVAGTHGKTTTTAMITTALELAGRDPSAVIGGKLPLINGYDYYGSMGELKFAFKRFSLMTQFMIFANADDRNTMDVMYTIQRRVRTFGIRNGGDYQAVNISEYRPGFYEFDLKEWDAAGIAGHIKLAVPGYHNIYNALAMCAVCRTMGLTVEQCAAALAEFKGVCRRFEVCGECNGAVVVDDYAHHPTEMRATLTTAKELGYKRLIAVHQPFTYSRTKMLLDDCRRAETGRRHRSDPHPGQPGAQRPLHLEREAGRPDPRRGDGRQPGRRRPVGQGKRQRGRPGHHPGLRRRLQGCPQDGAVKPAGLRAENFAKPLAFRRGMCYTV